MNRIDVRRVKELNNFKYNKGSVLYWMQRDKRVSDNWALLYAQQLAIEKKHHFACLLFFKWKFPQSQRSSIFVYGSRFNRDCAKVRRLEY